MPGERYKALLIVISVPFYKPPEPESGRVPNLIEPEIPKEERLGCCGDIRYILINDDSPTVEPIGNAGLHPWLPQALPIAVD